MIITVDDFGYNREANTLIFEVIEKGVIDQASTMVNMGGSEEALEYIRMSFRGAARRKTLPISQKSKIPASPAGRKSQDNAKFKNVRFGLHLNLTEGRPLTDPKEVPSLVDKTGQFLSWPGLIKRSIFGQLRLQDVERETRAQIEKLQTVVKPIPFLNSHHHIHLWPSIAKIIIPLCYEYGITHIRWPRKIWWRSVYAKYGLKAFTIQLLSMVTHYQLPETSQPDTNQYFFDLDWLGNLEKNLDKLLLQLPGNTEFNCHPLPNRRSTLQRLIIQDRIKRQ